MTTVPRDPYYRPRTNIPTSPGKPSSIFRVLRFEEAPSHRTLACGTYDLCVDVAAASGWPSFSCRECPQASGLTDDHATLTDFDAGPEEFDDE